MQIWIFRTGGFAGVRERVVQLDTRSLSPANANRVEDLVRQAGFFELPEQVDTGEVGTDLLRYEIEIQDNGAEHQVAFVASDLNRAGALGKIVQAAIGAAGVAGG